MRAVIFDWDGVLADSGELYFLAYAKICEIYKKRLPIDSKEGFRRWYNPAWENNYLEMGFTKEEISKALMATFQYVDYDQAAIYPHTAEVLEYLHAQNIPMAILSTTPEETIRRRLRQEGLEQYFTVISGYGGDSSKDKRLAQLMEKLHCSGGIMIGDTHLDIQAGKANKLKTIGTGYGWITPERLQVSNPDALVNSPDQLLGSIKQILSSLE
ncbi:HAD family hydrolase [bacterium]|nr:HAD family hydrolase [bacterium]